MMEMEKDKIVFKGTHPDSLYRVSTDDGPGAAGKFVRVLRLLRWPSALIAVCVALAVFVYFLMPDNMELNSVNGTLWGPEESGFKRDYIEQVTQMSKHREVSPHEATTHLNYGSKPSEIDFYDADRITDINPSSKRNLPVPPVFPIHLSPEVQYGNEKADTDKLRTPKILEDVNVLPMDSTLKPHITQKPEKPLAIYFKETGESTTSTESITRAETINDFTNYDQKLSSKKSEESLSYTKSRPSAYKPYIVPTQYAPSDLDAGTEPGPWLNEQEYYDNAPPKDGVKFTSGHSKLFGISIEDAERMKSTTQSSLYNTRVSPTLPTWRDRDDATTKKYPTNTYSDVQCRSTRMSLCRGVLPYDLAGAPVNINGVDITSLMPQINYLVSTNCSERVRHFVCALLEPECNPPPYPSKMPCNDFCKAVVDSCAGQIPRELLPAFNCKFYSSQNCIGARTPCYPREFTCGDGSCIPRDWMCDGNNDCPAGEEEAGCIQCDRNEYRCPSGSCIQKQWMCDGYADCPDGEDEREARCEHLAAEHDNEHELASGSAPAPSVSRPHRGHTSTQKHRSQNRYVAGDIDGSKELLEASDSSNALKRNFTRRPSPSRLSPYTRPRPRTTTEAEHKDKAQSEESTTEGVKEIEKSTAKIAKLNESLEDINMDDLGFFDPEEKETADKNAKVDKQEKKQATKLTITKTEVVTKAAGNKAPKHYRGEANTDRPRSFAPLPVTASSRQNKNENKFERVIDGASLLKKAAEQEAREAAMDIPEPDESGPTQHDADSELPPALRAGLSRLTGRVDQRAHASPCPSGELRCVDGLCITLAQLCDGTVDCSDHADEDNCYT